MTLKFLISVKGVKMNEDELLIQEYLDNGYDRMKDFEAERIAELKEDIKALIENSILIFE